MKKFTKGALILTLAIVVVGCAFCAIGFGVGFRYGTIREMAKEGIFSIRGNIWDWDDDSEEDYDSDYDNDSELEAHDSIYWQDAKTETFDFTKQGIENLDLDIYYGEVLIEESADVDHIKVTVKYKKENHKRSIESHMNGTTLVLEETGRKGYRGWDNIQLTIQIPAGMEFNEVNLKNRAGIIAVNTPILANLIDIQVDAGECEVNQKLTVKEELRATVGAGELNMGELETELLFLKAEVGGISTGVTQAKEVTIDCSVGSVDTTMAGSETDYSYSVECGVGDIEIGHNSYSGLSTSKEVVNSGDGYMEISCGVGEVNVSFRQ